MKNILSIGVRVFALVLIVLFFVPSVVVSCNGGGYEESFDVAVSPFNASTGSINLDEYNINLTEDDIEPYPVLFVMIAAAAVVLALGTKFPIVNMVMSVMCIVMQFVFLNRVTEFVNSNYSDSELEHISIGTSPVYAIYCVICVIIVVIETIIQFKLTDKLENIVNISKTSMATLTDEPGISCPKCGYNLPVGSTFCGSCGTVLDDPKNDDVSTESSSAEILVAVPTKKDTTTILPETADKCPKCGSTITTDTVFCEKCGFMMTGTVPQTIDVKDEKGETKEENTETPIKSTIAEKKEVSKKSHDAFHQMDDLG